MARGACLGAGAGQGEHGRPDPPLVSAASPVRCEMCAWINAVLYRRKALISRRLLVLFLPF